MFLARLCCGVGVGRGAQTNVAATSISVGREGLVMTLWLILT